jgi:hypothetical protein
VDVQSRQHPVADKGPKNSYDDVTDESEASAANDLAGQPPRDKPDKQNDEKAFIRHVHCFAPGSLSRIAACLIGTTTALKPPKFPIVMAAAAVAEFRSAIEMGAGGRLDIQRSLCIAKMNRGAN